MTFSFLLFWICCGLFLADMALGKIGVLTNGAVHEFLGKVPHFLLLALSAALLTVECLRREARRNGTHIVNEPGNSQAPSEITIEENPSK
ncbi:MAG: hypothetical protein P8Y71_15840 [Pseudolabrys sp.]|jgi:hypothetical protein